jgi:ABC-type nitrate/sulfonate/bicarbonate transport system substrate-binding protein
MIFKHRAQGLRAALALGLASIVLAACGAPPAATAPTAAPAAAAPTAAPAAAAPTTAPAAAEPTAAPAAAETPAAPVRIAYASDLDPADVADQLAFDLLNEKYGVETTVTELNEDSAVVAGLISGDIDIGNMDVTAAIKAYQVGVPMLVLMPANNAVEFVLIGQPGIKTVQDLRGKRVAFHAPGSGTEILPRLLVRQSGDVSEDEIEWIVLPESPNRAAAMEADRIDVTALEFADVLTLREGGKQYELIASFYDVAPEAIATAWVTSADFAAANPELLATFVQGMGEGYAQAGEDKAAWMTKAESMLDVPTERLEQTYDFYSDINMFPKAPFFTPEIWEQMNAFYVGAGEFEDPAPWEMVNSAALEAAAAQSQ